MTVAYQLQACTSTTLIPNAGLAALTVGTVANLDRSSIMGSTFSPLGTSSNRFILVRFHNYSMTLQANISRLFERRALLIIAALISLGVSNNVGPQFLPLPTVLDRGSESQWESQHNTASRPPSSGKSDNFRVPIMAQTQKRAETKPPPQSLATALNGGCVQPDDARPVCEFSYATLLFTSASVSQPPGRAPPRLL